MDVSVHMRTIVSQEASVAAKAWAGYNLEYKKNRVPKSRSMRKTRAKLRKWGEECVLRTDASLVVIAVVVFPKAQDNDLEEELGKMMDLVHVQFQPSVVTCSYWAQEEPRS